MARTAKPCARCGEPHFNFQKCRVRETQKQNVSIHHTKPNLPEGYRVWHRDYLDEFERRGNLVVQRSGLRLRPHGGTIIEPKEQHD